MITDTMSHSTDLSSKREQLICLISGGLVFLISLVISRMYTGGDQVGYHNVYAVVSGLGLDDRWRDIHIIYLSRISAAEWVHLLVSLVGGVLDIEKNLLMSLVNAILAAYTVRLFLFWGASVWVATGLVLTNYYFYVLYFAAERLKFAFLFLVLSLLFSRKKLCFIASTFLSIFSHFSIVFVYAGIWLSRVSERLTQGRRISRWAIIASLAALAVFLPWNWDYLLWKLNNYQQTSGPMSVAKVLPIAVLLMLCCLYAKKKSEPVLALLPVLAGILMLDGSRLNMLGFFIFLYYGVQSKGGLNAGTVAVMLYFAYKTVIFVDAIYFLGQGFGVSG